MMMLANFDNATQTTDCLLVVKEHGFYFSMLYNKYRQEPIHFNCNDIDSWPAQFYAPWKINNFVMDGEYVSLMANERETNHPHVLVMHLHDRSWSLWRLYRVPERVMADICLKTAAHAPVRGFECACCHNESGDIAFIVFSVNNAEIVHYCNLDSTDNSTMTNVRRFQYIHKDLSNAAAETESRGSYEETKLESESDSESQSVSSASFDENELFLFARLRL